MTPALHLAIEQQHVEIARRLIAAGADVNRDHGQGWTPLVHAIDIESDAAWQQHGEPNREATDLTELLLSATAGRSICWRGTRAEPPDSLRGPECVRPECFPLGDI